MTNYEIRPLQLRLLEILLEIHKVCEEHNLRYYLVDGSLIGAIRHKGFIPWDDDMDIAMPRTDYELLIQHCKEWLPKRYEFVCYENDKNYPLQFGKIQDAQSTLIERPHLYYLGGVYVDIFPIDGTSSDLVEAKRETKTFKHITNKLDATLAHLTFKEYISLLFQPKEWGRMAYQTAAFLFGRETIRKRIIRKLNAIVSAHDYSTATYVSNYAFLWVQPKEWFTTTTKKTFEGTEVNLPGGYHNYLTDIFGDYMQLPPEEERVSLHHHAYVDLYKRSKPSKK